MTALGTGLAGGLIGGPVNSAVHETSPWLDQGIARTLNEQATTEQMFGLGNLVRTGAGGVIANSPSTLP